MDRKSPWLNLKGQLIVEIFTMINCPNIRIYEFRIRIFLSAFASIECHNISAIHVDWIVFANLIKSNSNIVRLDSWIAKNKKLYKWHGYLKCIDPIDFEY